MTVFKKPPQLAHPRNGAVLEPTKVGKEVTKNEKKVYPKVTENEKKGYQKVTEKESERPTPFLPTPFCGTLKKTEIYPVQNWGLETP